MEFANRHLFCYFFFFMTIVIPMIFASVKFNQRIFLSERAIHYVDPTKHGFRVILHDEFIRAHMVPIMLPTLYLSAIQLRPPMDDGEQPSQQQQQQQAPIVTKVYYPDTVAEERQASIDGLREQSWYYLCLEWENFNRHNETTGTDCRLLRTLDRLGRGADSTVAHIEATDFSSQMLQFRIRAGAEFPMRLTASLEGGKAPMPAAQVFQLSGGESPVELELVFPLLRQQMDYGQLCVLEEPLIRGYTALGRLVANIHIKKCHFNNLTTTDYLTTILDSAEASPYIRGANSAAQFGHSGFAIPVALLLAICWRLL